MSLQKEDVYETEDLPEDDQQLIEDEVHEGEEVQRVHIDVGEAMKRFKGRLVNAENVDFSDSIARKKRRGYGGGAYVLEVVGPYADENETLEQKLTRLECEVNDLVEALRFQEPQKEDKSEARVAREDYLISLLEELKAMKVKRNMIEISPGNEENKPGEAKAAADIPSAVKATDENIGDGQPALEKRISRLEQAIGGTAGLDAASKVPLAEAVEEMQLRLQLLNPTHIDGLHARATKLLAKMQQVEDKKNEKEDSEFEEKVEKLYDMMNRWDAACIGLPSAVRRMYDLRKLHEQAEQFSKKLSLLMGIREQLSKTMKNKELAMLEFREQIHGALEKLTSDMEKLEERIKKLAP